jgi:hypothetical protein
MHGKCFPYLYANVVVLRVMSPMIVFFVLMGKGFNGVKLTNINQVINLLLGRNNSVFGAWKLILRQISLGVQAYDTNNPPPDAVILQPELHCKTCPVCDKIWSQSSGLP